MKAEEDAEDRAENTKEDIQVEVFEEFVMNIGCRLLLIMHLR